jgi:hypothetical protein
LEGNSCYQESIGTPICDSCELQARLHSLALFSESKMQTTTCKQSKEGTKIPEPRLPPTKSAVHTLDLTGHPAISEGMYGAGATLTQQVLDAETITSLAEQYKGLRSQLTLSLDDSNTYRHSELTARYHQLAEKPVNSFLTIVCVTTFNNDGNMELSKPFLTLVRAPGVTWRGHPVPMDPFSFQDVPNAQ